MEEFNIVCSKEFFLNNKNENEIENKKVFLKGKHLFSIINAWLGTQVQSIFFKFQVNKKIQVNVA